MALVKWTLDDDRSMMKNGLLDWESALNRGNDFEGRILQLIGGGIDDDGCERFSRVVS